MTGSLFKLSIYRILDWNILFILLGIISISAGILAKIYSFSLLNNPDKNIHNGISCLVVLLIIFSPIWGKLLYRIITELYIDKSNNILNNH